MVRLKDTQLTALGHITAANAALRRAADQIIGGGSPSAAYDAIDCADDHTHQLLSDLKYLVSWGDND